jgi:hypothetical protein
MLYKIVGSYNGGAFEKIDTAHTLKDAKALKEEYELSYGNLWRISFYRME